MTTATLKYTPVELKGDFKDAGLELSIDLPNGKKEKLAWTPKNDYTLTLPLVLNYRDDFGKVKVMFDNYPQTILNLHPDKLTLVEVKEAPLVQAPIVTQPKNKKENKNEKQK